MGQFPEQICEELMTYCLAPDCMMGGLGGDNMTVVLICFLHNKPYEELIKRCASSLEQPANGVSSFNDPDRFKPRMTNINGDLHDPESGSLSIADAAAAAVASSSSSSVDAPSEGQTESNNYENQNRTLNDNVGNKKSQENDENDDDDDDDDSENDLK